MLDILEEECLRFQHVCDEDVYNLCVDILSDGEYRGQQNDPYDAVQLYLYLRTKIHSLL